MKASFQQESEFAKELKQEVREYLSQDAKGKFANTSTWIKGLLLIGICCTLYCGILFLDASFISRIFLTLVFAFFTLLLGLNVMHESVHGNYSKKSWVNKCLALSFDIFGISSDLYLIKHTQFHHNYTNIFELDGDINEAPLIRMSEDHPWMPVHRYQVYYTPLLYSLITITWPIFDLGRLISPKVGNQTFRRPTLEITLKILFFKMVNLYLNYILPIQILGSTVAIPLILVFHLSVGTILALVFQIAHVHEELKFKGSQIETDWFIHQLNTSADFSTSNTLATWICGGLNFQTIHHLFPNVSYRHYPEIQKILKVLCKKHGLRYTEFPSFTDAVQKHFKLLNSLSVG